MTTKVLAVDDDPAVLRLLESHLTRAGYDIVTARTGREAMVVFQDQRPRVVITDLMIPELGGLDLCRAIRSAETPGFVYILVLSSHSETPRILEAFDAGADDFLPKPFNRYELVARLHAGTRILKLEEELAQDRLAIHKANAELLVLNRKLHQMATTDVLTSLSNRREAIRSLGDLWAIAARQGQPLSCMMLDIDNFKSINDRYGHEAGDAVLRGTAKILKATARADETVCRIGGEEFLILCPLSDAQAAAAGAERLRGAVETTPMLHGGVEIDVTVSIGVAQKSDGSDTTDELLKRADSALYTAKQTGRNRVCIAGQQQGSATQRASGPSTSPSVSPLSEDPPLRVLVVDDDESSRQLCRGLLEKQGYEVLEACDGIDGLEKARSLLPDLILMDVAMPRLDGVACTQRLKFDAATREIPIIIVSSRSEGQDFEAAMNAEADEYITKPFRPKEFIYRVGSVSRLFRSKADLVRSNAVRGSQARAMGILLDMSRNLAASSNLDDALEKIIAATAELTLSQRVSIMLPDRNGKNLTVAKSIGIDDEVVTGVNLPIGGQVAGQVYLSREPILINKPEQAATSLGLYESRFFVSAPMLSSALRTTDRVVGVLNITERYDGRAYDPIDLEYIDLICNTAASVIDVIQSRNSRDDAHTAIMVALAKLAEHRDDDTGKHLDRVTNFSVMLAKQLRDRQQYKEEIDDAYLSDLERAVPLHDIGKVAIPDRILLKPGKLTPDEMAIMRSHVDVGANTIRSVLQRTPNVRFLQMALEIVSGHHEWYDGSGYPRGVKSEDIPLCARVVALADVYDALTTSRPYKKAFSHDSALETIRSATGTQFDPAVVEAFIKKHREFAQVSAQLANAPVNQASPV